MLCITRYVFTKKKKRKRKKNMHFAQIMKAFQDEEDKVEFKLLKCCIKNLTISFFINKQAI